LLYFPVIHSNQEAADFLFQQGAESNVSSPDGITPLYGAVLFSNLQMARWPLERGDDLNPRYEDMTPLAMALENKYYNLVQNLRSFGGIEQIRYYRPLKL
jgi:ankyrin repeat protein